MKREDELKAAVKENFSLHAEKYVQSVSHAKSGDLPMLVEWLQPQKDWNVLDIATGGGHVAKILSPHVGTVWSTDLTRKMLEAAARHLEESGCHNVNYVVADAEDLPFLDGTFYAVTCRIAPHHFPNQDRFIAEAARVLKPGGRFLLIDNVAPEDDALDAYMNTVEKLRDESHVRCAKISEWREWFKSAGLFEEQASAHKKTFTFPSWVERTARSQEQMEAVERFIQEAAPEVQEYFYVMQENGRVQNFRIDEWMVLCRK
jgi:ubiquinone/menaquinone biosynthesis C-methylase UbiE